MNTSTPSQETPEEKELREKNETMRKLSVSGRQLTLKIQPLLDMAFPLLGKKLYQEHMQSLYTNGKKPDIHRSHIGNMSFAIEEGKDAITRVLRIAKTGSKTLEIGLHLVPRQADDTVEVIANRIGDHKSLLEVKDFDEVLTVLGDAEKNLKDTQGPAIARIQEEEAKNMRWLLK